MCLALKPHVSASISTSIILRCSSTWADPVPLSAARLCDFKMVTTRGRSWPPQVQGDLETRPRAAQHHGSGFWGGGDRASSRREVPLYCGHPQWRWPPEPMRGGICTHRWGLTPDLWSVHILWNWWKHSNLHIMKTMDLILEHFLKCLLKF